MLSAFSSSIQHFFHRGRVPKQTTANDGDGGYNIDISDRHLSGCLCLLTMQLKSTGVPMTSPEERLNQQLRGSRKIYMYVKSYLDFLRLPSLRQTIRKPNGNKSRPLQQYMLQIQQGQPTLDS